MSSEIHNLLTSIEDAFSEFSFENVAAPATNNSSGSMGQGGTSVNNPPASQQEVRGFVDTFQGGETSAHPTSYNAVTSTRGGIISTGSGGSGIINYSDTNLANERGGVLRGSNNNFVSNNNGIGGVSIGGAATLGGSAPVNPSARLSTAHTPAYASPSGAGVGGGGLSTGKKSNLKNRAGAYPRSTEIRGRVVNSKDSVAKGGNKCFGIVGSDKLCLDQVVGKNDFKACAHVSHVANKFTIPHSEDLLMVPAKGRSSLTTQEAAFQEPSIKIEDLIPAARKQICPIITDDKGYRFSSAKFNGSGQLEDFIAVAKDLKEQADEQAQINRTLDYEDVDETEQAPPVASVEIYTSDPPPFDFKDVYGDDLESKEVQYHDSESTSAPGDEPWAAPITSTRDVVGNIAGKLEALTNYVVKEAEKAGNNTVPALQDVIERTDKISRVLVQLEGALGDIHNLTIDHEQTDVANAILSCLEASDNALAGGSGISQAQLEELNSKIVDLGSTCASKDMFSQGFASLARKLSTLLAAVATRVATLEKNGVGPSSSFTTNALGQPNGGISLSTMLFGSDNKPVMTLEQMLSSFRELGERQARAEDMATAEGGVSFSRWDWNTKSDLKIWLTKICPGLVEFAAFVDVVTLPAHKDPMDLEANPKTNIKTMTRLGLANAVERNVAFLARARYPHPYSTSDKLATSDVLQCFKSYSDWKGNSNQDGEKKNVKDMFKEAYKSQLAYAKQTLPQGSEVLDLAREMGKFANDFCSQFAEHADLLYQLLQDVGIEDTDTRRLLTEQFDLIFTAVFEKRRQTMLVKEGLNVQEYVVDYLWNTLKGIMVLESFLEDGLSDNPVLGVAYARFLTRCQGKKKSGKDANAADDAKKALKQSTDALSASTAATNSAKSAQTESENVRQYVTNLIELNDLKKPASKKGGRR